MAIEKRIDDIRIQGIYDFGYGIVAKMVMCDNTISTGAKALYAYICTFANSKKKAWPGRAKICLDLNISKDSFTKYINELKMRGYIIVKHRKNEKGQFLGNAYIIVTQFADPLQENPCPKEPCPEKPDTEQMPVSSQPNPCPKKPCPEKPGMKNPCPKEPCPEKPDTEQMPVSSQLIPCPKKPCPEKPCPEISDTNSTSTNITKEQQRDLALGDLSIDQVAKEKPESFSSHNAVVVFPGNENVKKQNPLIGKKTEISTKEVSRVLLNEDCQDMVPSLIKFGVDRQKAEQLAKTYDAKRIIHVLRYTQSKKPSSASGYIIRALENNWGIPEVVTQTEKTEKKEDLLKEKTRKLFKNLELAQKKADPAAVGIEHIGSIISRLRNPNIPSF